MFSNPLQEENKQISSGFIISNDFKTRYEQIETSKISSKALENAKREAQRLMSMNRPRSKKIVFKNESKRFNHGHFVMCLK